MRGFLKTSFAGFPQRRVKRFFFLPPVYGGLPLFEARTLLPILHGGFLNHEDFSPPFNALVTGVLVPAEIFFKSGYGRRRL